MQKNRLAIVAAAALLGLAGCQENKEAPATNELSEAPTREAVTPAGAPVPDAPAPAITDPASPTPEGTDVGAMGADATATVRTGDTAAVRAAHP
ncbi:MAG TPA: hypothetical protein VGR37_12430 [Longimicrobiaceae bacterium]|nr:hypothetical protein [Longimicrobiaceae bacterium]